MTHGMVGLRPTMPSRLNRRRSLEAGFDCHLVKPVEPDALQSLLATSHRDSGGR